MFEDGPPPLPSSLSHTEGSPDGGLADLDDDNRLTAVADDDDSDSINLPNLPSPMGIPDFEPDSFVEVPRSSSKQDPEDVTLSQRKDCDRIAGDSVAEATVNASPPSEAGHLETFPQETNQTEIDSSKSKNCKSSKEVERLHCDAEVSKDEIPDCIHQSSCQSNTMPPMESESESRPVQPGRRRTESGDSPIRSVESIGGCEVPPAVESTETRINESCARVDEEATRAVKRSSVGEMDMEITCEPSSVSADFLETTDDTTTAVDGTFDNQVTDSQRETAENEEEDDDFGDFEEFGDFADIKPVQNEEEKNSAGWAAFETTPSVSNEPVEGGQDDWAADFSNAPPAPQPKLQTPACALVVQCDGVKLCPLCDVLEDDALWSADNVDWEGSDNESDPCNEDHSDGIVEDLDRTQPKLDNLKHWQSLWLSVSIVEEALALKMQWTHSAFYSSFLDALHLDANMAAMRNSNLPAFAQHLGGSAAVLQPVTSTVTSVTTQVNKSESAPRIFSMCQSPSESSTPSLPLKELNEPEGLSHANKEQRPRSVPVDSLAVPPAQFDWGNSGLTNPLTAGSISASSALLDLDFLTANESKIVTIAGRSSTTADISAALQRDLAALGLNTTTNAQSIALGSSNAEHKTSILEELMRKEKRQHKYTRSSELSLDARALHDQLPDIDFMLANVLLFPMTDR